MSMPIQFSSLISGSFSPNHRLYYGKKPVSSFRCMASLSSDPEFNTKEFRKNLTRREDYNKKGFGRKKETLELISREYYSDVIKTLNENGNEYTWGSVTVKLAESYGFCWGVERAIQLVYEAKNQFPDQKIWITNEIIHNPTFSKKVEKLNIEHLPKNEESKKQYDVIEKGDVIMFPAHGVAVEEMMILSEKNVQIVDTTCPWVSKVWTTVEKHKNGEYTSIIHGSYDHQETIGTKSFAGNYVVVKNMAEAIYVCDYILGGLLDGSSSSKEAFLEKFKDKVSEGFDPDNNLVKVGIANQTTMVKGETEEIGKLVERTMMQKYGVENIKNHLMSFNTLCDATHERQDALAKLLENQLDMMLVVGGWNSNNTGHLQMISEKRGIPAYWIDTEERIGPGNKITYKLSHGDTPDKVIEDVLLKVFAIKNGLHLQHA
ncbi:4-hydroxy-3-methylbut-2-enyl diphosphate reductase [Heracleum sosnowskyi]|uniref:4-hydroxy-3-methylbut-2-enyl diphosphate reductase n=1 Tax=Heracleum sosnowskyi TaxID=360622 RepID=A0AAD8NCD8_9APIA|nr:4-hydroxy-3-methylbut-2-enyl diphosphate reductase [Heracleum sosnowskyi]